MLHEREPTRLGRRVVDVELEAAGLGTALPHRLGEQVANLRHVGRILGGEQNVQADHRHLLALLYQHDRPRGATCRFTLPARNTPGEHADVGRQE